MAEENIGGDSERDSHTFEVLAGRGSVVAVKNYKTHPVYKKRVEVRKKYHVDDQQQIARPGDTVEIEECRPLSATKRFRLVRVISKGE